VSLQSTPALGLPLLQSGQAQKHITLNEALWRLDACVQARVLSRSLTAQPAAPQEGDAYILPSDPSGTVWDGEAENGLLVWRGGEWERLDLPEGGLVYVGDEGGFVVRTAAGWVALQVSFDAFDNLQHVGIGAEADAENRLTVSSPRALFTHAGHGSLICLNKAAASDEAGIVFQTGFSTRAMLGLLGDERLTLKVSPDGTAFSEVLSVESDSLSAHRALKPAVDNGLSLGGAGARWQEVWAASGVIQTSDRRDKVDVEAIADERALAFVGQVAPILFRWRDQPEGPFQAGFVAQEVAAARAALSPDDARTLNLCGLENPADPDSRQWLRPDQMLAVLWAALRALHTEITTLKTR